MTAVVNSAWESLVEDYQPLLRSIAWTFRRRLEFDDACSYGAFGLMEAAKSFRQGSGSFGAYARTKIRWSIIDGVRHEIGRVGLHYIPVMPLCDEIAERLEDDSSPGMDIMLEAAELRRAVSRLTPRSRQILEGYYFGGRTFREIAKVMELSESRVGQLHRTAIGELRQVLLGMGYSACG